MIETIEILATVGVAAAAAAELAARAWLARHGRSFVWAPFARARLELDRDVLPTLEPVVEHSINADGERGDPVPDSNRGLFRVLVAGGSASECYYLDQSSTWPHVVQDMLREPESLRRLRAERVHVGSIARSLVTARHVDAILEEVLPNYERLDAIVFMVGASDVVHWLENHAPATIVERPIPPSTLFAQHAEGPFGWGPKTLALRRLASIAKRRLLRPVEHRRNVGRRLGEARAMRNRAIEILRETSDPKPMVDAFERWFDSLLARARAKARHVVVVQQPWLQRDFSPEELQLGWSFGAGRPYAGEVKSYYAYETAWKLLKLVDERADLVARRHGLERVLLTPILDASFDDYYDEMHHTPRGCKKIGQSVARAILDAVSQQQTPSIPAPLPSLPSSVRELDRSVISRRASA